MAENPVLVSIYMRPYLVDYCIHYYGEHPIRADARSKLLPLLTPYLSQTPAKFRPLIPGPNLITFELPYNEVRDIRKLNYISPEHYAKIQTYLYNMFQWHFFLYMDENCLHKNMPFKATILNFMDFNEISYDNFHYDSLKRIYFRHRKKCAQITI